MTGPDALARAASAAASAFRPWVCPHCGRTVAIPGPCGCAGEATAAAAAREERSRSVVEAAKGRLMRRSGIPERALGTETNPAAPAMAEACGSGCGFCIWGPSGTGKTTLAAQVGAAWVESNLLTCRDDRGAVVWAGEGRSCRMVTVADLLAGARAFFDGGGDPVADASGAGLLILDDLGSERASAWSVSVLFHVVDARYRAGLPLVCCSRKDLPACGEAWARFCPADDVEALLVRLSAMCAPVGLR
ncbi:hypothetical protein [Caniella muris]|uniref:hypothetical protein n=1 Tax=Caniella muris TaxID=2941502 RepID=UPI00203DB03D|nr:hypothetical protein [Caniella muris]